MAVPKVQQMLLNPFLWHMRDYDTYARIGEAKA